MPNVETTAAIQQARARNRLLLTEVEAKALLGAAGIVVAPAKLAQTREEAVALALEIGFPVVLKICSPDVVHKSDTGGGKLNLHSGEEIQTNFCPISTSFR